MKPRCEICRDREARQDPWMPPAYCCECGRASCSECLDPSFLEVEGTYVCRSCAKTVYGRGTVPAVAELTEEERTALAALLETRFMASVMVIATGCPDKRGYMRSAVNKLRDALKEV